MPSSTPFRQEKFLPFRLGSFGKAKCVRPSVRPPCFSTTAQDNQSYLTLASRSKHLPAHTQSAILPLDCSLVSQPMHPTISSISISISTSTSTSTYAANGNGKLRLS
ncbi:hypothetical protein DHEL01_v202667 [Diaporthe helianthi]|uniref:Uncharacterized protein n=1 Tax=Diaporthe helianthi TaxID=158607 RepID=A0A2P5I8V0_DIAHE|nr:hypothetical protein DHEL01_v202667 [Diaporthe helianthi]